MKEKKVILITGASSGMGKVAAIDLIKQGHKVYTAARRVENMKDLEELGGFPMHLDISKEESIVSLVDKVIEAEGKVDVLWNNAGFGLWGSVEDTSIDQARYQFEVNLFGLARLTQLIIPYMREQKSGTIINTSSVGGKVYTPLGAWYHATKHALEGWSDCLRIELMEFGIDVVVLEPGAIETEFGNPMLDSLLKNSQEGAYAQLAGKVVKATKASYEKPGGSSKPVVISNTIQKIIKERKPSTRYLVGKYAKPMACLRRVFGDRVFDKVILSTINTLGK